MKTIIIIMLISNFTQETNTIEHTFSENIEYCQNVYITGKNPLNEKCDFKEVKKSLFIKF